MTPTAAVRQGSEMSEAKHTALEIFHSDAFGTIVGTRGLDAKNVAIFWREDEAREFVRAANAHADLLAALVRYIQEVPAFRAKLIGATDSPARAQQLAHIAAEDAARVNTEGEWTATPPDQPGLRYHWRDEHGERDILIVYRTGDGHLAAQNSKGLFGRLHEWRGEWWSVPIQEPPA